MELKIAGSFTACARWPSGVSRMMIEFVADRVLRNESRHAQAGRNISGTALPQRERSRTMERNALVLTMDAGIFCQTPGGIDDTPKENRRTHRSRSKLMAKALRNWGINIDRPAEQIEAADHGGRDRMVESGVSENSSAQPNSSFKISWAGAVRDIDDLKMEKKPEGPAVAKAFWLRPVQTDLCSGMHLPHCLILRSGNSYMESR